MARTVNPLLHETRRQQILRAAREVFARRGFREASMQEICQAAGISAGAAYRYFAGKLDIVDAISQDCLWGVTRAFTEIAEAPNFEAAIAEGIDRLMVYGAESGEAPMITDLLAEASQSADVMAMLRSQEATIRGLIEKAIRRAQVRGIVPASVDCARAAFIIMAVKDGLYLRAALLRDPETLSLAKASLLHVVRQVLQLEKMS